MSGKCGGEGGGARCSFLECLAEYMFDTPLFDTLLVRGWGGRESSYHPVLSVQPTTQLDVCAAQICLCDFEGGDMLRQLPCKHEFHQPCIDSWAAHHRTCPLCRYLLWEPPAPLVDAPAIATAGATLPADTVSSALPLAQTVGDPGGGEGDGAPPPPATPPAPTAAAAGQPRSSPGSGR